MIQARGLGVRRGSAWVLQDVDLTLERGDIVGLIGPPESGKTTLLKALAGLVPTTTGTVAIDGLPAILTSDAWQRRIGFAFQNDALFDALSVFENVAFPLRRRRVRDAEIAPRVAHILREVGLDSAADTMPDSLSGGMRKRAGIARAVVIEPEVGLFDDPVAGLDPQTSARILRLLCNLATSLNVATMIVSNDLDVLLPVCHRIVMLCAGRVVYSGSPKHMTQSPRPEVVQFVTGADAGPL